MPVLKQVVGAVQTMTKTILLLDDSATIRSVIKVYLTGRPFSFLEAERAERGLQILKVAHVDLIIVDVQLPGMSGLEFVNQVRKDSNVPIIMLTAQKSDEIREQGLQAGANIFIQKPVFDSGLLAAVNLLLPTDATDDVKRTE